MSSVDRTNRADRTDGELEARIENRAWLMEWRRWVQWVERVHTGRQMRPQEGWGWLYAATDVGVADATRRAGTGD